jgi:hypothetical protein
MQFFPLYLIVFYQRVAHIDTSRFQECENHASAQNQLVNLNTQTFKCT